MNKKKFTIMSLLLTQPDYFSVISSYLPFRDVIHLSLTCKEVKKMSQHDIDFTTWIRIWNGEPTDNFDLIKFINNIRNSNSVPHYPKWDGKDRVTRKLVSSVPKLQVKELIVAVEIDSIMECIPNGKYWTRGKTGELCKFSIDPSLTRKRVIVLDFYNKIIRNK